tara:strand:+ start:1887 stop:3002 length:1116 start_codon:yes stop_codon:yes gene_type:complete
MRVAVNTRLLIENELEGIGRFSYEILKKICEKNPNIKFDFIFDRPFSKKFIFNENVTGHILSPQTRHPFLWYYWFEIKIPKLLKKINPDVFLSMDGFISSSIKNKQIAVIHDINFEHYPENLPFFHRKYYQYFFPKYAKKAKAIITVSNYSKQDIVKTYGVENNKVHVIYNGVSNTFTTINEREKIKIKDQYTSGQNFFIFIGSIHKRKNISNLLKAFNLYKLNFQSQTKLLIVGKKRWWSKEMKEAFKNSNFKNDILFTGYLTETNLPKVLASSLGLCFPSLFEGFGLPIIEAMKCGVPVITSNTSSMPEICGDAGIKIDPYNIHEISNAMSKIESNQKFREQLIKLGLSRSEIFNWETASDQLLEILKN